MRMTAENKEWMAHALFLGEDNMNLFADSRWEWISETYDEKWVPEVMEGTRYYNITEENIRNWACN